MSQSEKIGSTPSFSDFNPLAVPYQARVLDDMEFLFDYSLGVHEILLSGSVGSAKSILMAHCGIRHCLSAPRARLCIARQAMPDLRDTIFTKILEHLEGTVKSDGSLFKEGKDFGFSTTHCTVWFANRSEISAQSWADKKFKKLGSLEFSAAVVEELTENDGDYWQAIPYLRTRVGRLPHIKKSWIMYGTNPDSPSHPAYEYFEIGRRQQGEVKGLNKTRHVYFSSTRDNPFLPAWYINQLESDLDPKLVRRLVYGEWIEIKTDVIYHAYGPHNFRDETYEVDPFKDIYLNFDFNIGEGKPMSACLSQVEKLKDGDLRFHFFNEAVVEGADTEDLLEDMAARGLLDYPSRYVINGDAHGGSRSTKSKLTDYEVITQFLAKYRTARGEKVDFALQVPRANPPVRTRHNVVNAYCKNALGKVRLLVYKECKILDKGMKLTALKSGGHYIEDDSKPYQHVTTALGYHVLWVHGQNRSQGPSYKEVKIR